LDRVRESFARLAICFVRGEPTWRNVASESPCALSYCSVERATWRLWRASRLGSLSEVFRQATNLRVWRPVALFALRLFVERAPALCATSRLARSALFGLGEQPCCRCGAQSLARFAILGRSEQLGDWWASRFIFFPKPPACFRALGRGQRRGAWCSPLLSCPDKQNRAKNMVRQRHARHFSHTRRRVKR